MYLVTPLHPEMPSDTQLDLSASFDILLPFLKHEGSFGITNLSVENKNIAGYFSAIHTYIY